MALRGGDLAHMMHDVFEVDGFKSKMGEDSDIVVLSFSLSTKDAGDDLENFLEKGYPFVLDADVTPGEQHDGTYKVFVEIERTKECPAQIYEIVSGILRLADKDKLRFRYYKNFKSQEATLENLENIIPKTADEYEISTTQIHTENYKNFFNNSYIESAEMLDDILTLRKSFADPISFEVLDFDDASNINLSESFDMKDFAEVIFLSKYIGDYNITKSEDKFIFEQENKRLVLRKY